MKSFHAYTQLDAMDCGPTCLRMIAKHYSLETLRRYSFITREGVSMLGISDAAEHIGFRTSDVMISFEQFVTDVPLPCIVHWIQNHFVVVYDIKKGKKGEYRIYVADPALGLVAYSGTDFKKCWLSNKRKMRKKERCCSCNPDRSFLTAVRRSRKN